MLANTKGAKLVHPKRHHLAFASKCQQKLTIATWAKASPLHKSAHPPHAQHNVAFANNWQQKVKDAIGGVAPPPRTFSNIC